MKKSQRITLARAEAVEKCAKELMGLLAGRRLNMTIQAVINRLNRMVDEGQEVATLVVFSQIDPVRSYAEEGLICKAKGIDGEDLTTFQAFEHGYPRTVYREDNIIVEGRHAKQVMDALLPVLEQHRKAYQEWWQEREALAKEWEEEHPAPAKLTLANARECILALPGVKQLKLK